MEKETTEQTLQEASAALWESANNHSTIMGGEFLVENCEDMPKQPMTVVETMQAVKNYLDGSY